MPPSIQHLARTIAKARHGTDVHWAHYVGAAEAVYNQQAVSLHKLYGAYPAGPDYPDRAEVWNNAINAAMRALLAQPDGAQEGGE